MHELGGLFCKTGKLWINRKIPGAEKKHHGPNPRTGACAGGGSPMGLGPSAEEPAWGSGAGPPRPIEAGGTLSLVRRESGPTGPGLALHWAGP